ncbi:UNVERIFIED_CONTAM: hypothetical protein K2H54_075374 [Gekko kuhli]
MASSGHGFHLSKAKQDPEGAIACEEIMHERKVFLAPLACCFSPSNFLPFELELPQDGCKIPNMDFGPWEGERKEEHIGLVLKTSEASPLNFPRETKWDLQMLYCA